MDLKVLEKYGVTLQNALSPETLPTLRKAYVSLVTGLDSSKESVEKEADTLLNLSTDVAKKNEEVVFVSQEFGKQVRSLLDEVLSWNPETSYLLVDEIQKIKQETMLERDYQMSVIKRTQPTKKAATEDFEAKKEEAAILAEAIRAIFVMVKDSLPTTKKFAESFPIKDSETAGKLPDLPKLPRTPGDSGGNVGRSAKVRRLRFSWAEVSEDGNFGPHEILPLGTLVTDVAHDYVSNRASGFVVDFRAIKEAIEESKQEMFGNSPWVVSFPTGQLTGWLPES